MVDLYGPLALLSHPCETHTLRNMTDKSLWKTLIPQISLLWRLVRAVSGSAQEAPHPALRPHNCKLKASQGLCKARGAQVLISPHRLGPWRCRGQSCNAAVDLHLWPSQVMGGHWLGKAVQPPPFLSFHMPSVPLLGLWPPSGTNHPPWIHAG